MSIEISPKTEAWLAGEARKLGVSVEQFLGRLMDESLAAERISNEVSMLELPVLHLGAMGELHRREIYDDAT
jgi:hypothetical protein